MKIKQLQSFLQEKNIDAALFFNLDGMHLQADMFYFSQYHGYGTLLIPQQGKPILIVPELDEGKARKTACKVIVWKKKKLFDIITEVMQKQHINKEKIALNESTTNLALYKALKKNLCKKIVNIQEKVRELRREKTAKEIEIIKEACKLKCSIFNKTISQFKEFKTESDVAAYFQYLAAKKGCEISFPTIVGSGKNGAFPHHETANAKLQKGFCVIDCGIRYKNYCTDMTRTIYLGNPTKKDKERYHIVLQTQESVMQKYVIGTKCSGLDEYARKLLGKYEKYFIHSLGHGVGLEVHEAPGIGMRSKEVLQENDYVTNEPGIYIPNKFGIRIEDDILITKKRPLVLTKPCFKEFLSIQ